MKQHQQRLCFHIILGLQLQAAVSPEHTHDRPPMTVIGASITQL
jgi:hypothetical protein